MIWNVGNLEKFKVDLVINKKLDKQDRYMN